MKKLAVRVQIQHATTHNQRMTIETAGDFRPVWPEDGKRSASDDRQVTKRSAESVPPEQRGLRGRGGERPFSSCESARSAANWRKRGSEMNPEGFAGANGLRQIPKTKQRKESSAIFKGGCIAVENESYTCEK
jgi:hypothetical protein